MGGGGLLFICTFSLKKKGDYSAIMGLHFGDLVIIFISYLLLLCDTGEVVYALNLSGLIPRKSHYC